MQQAGIFCGMVRRHCGVSLKAVSISAGVDASYLCRVESGEKPLTKKLALAYADETGHAELKMLSDSDVSVVAEIYTDRLRAAQAFSALSEMQRLPKSLAAIAGVL